MPQAFTKILTPQEKRIKLLMFTAFSVAKIAKMLKITQSAVNNSLRHVYTKEGVANRAGLMAKEIQRCYAELETVKTQSKT